MIAPKEGEDPQSNFRLLLLFPHLQAKPSIKTLGLLSLLQPASECSRMPSGTRNPAYIGFWTDLTAVSWNSSVFRNGWYDPYKLLYGSCRMLYGLCACDRFVDLLASFPKSRRTLKTELRVKIYDCFKFRCWNFSIRCSGRICSHVCCRVEADTTRTRSYTGRVRKSRNVVSSSISLESCKIRANSQQYHILWIFQWNTIDLTV